MMRVLAREHGLTRHAMHNFCAKRMVCPVYNWCAAQRRGYTGNS
jgi:hypothetical protein